MLQMRRQASTGSFFERLGILECHKSTTVKREIQIMEAMNEDLLTIKLKQDKPTTTQPLENYAEKAKTNLNKLKRKVQLASEVEQVKIVILATNCSSKQIRNSEIASKSKKRLLPFMQTKNYCTSLLPCVVVYILSLQHQRVLAVFCRDGEMNSLGATRRFGELVKGMNSTAP